MWVVNVPQIGKRHVCQVGEAEPLQPTGRPALMARSHSRGRRGECGRSSRPFPTAMAQGASRGPREHRMPTSQPTAKPHPKPHHPAPSRPSTSKDPSVQKTYLTRVTARWGTAQDLHPNRRLCAAPSHAHHSGMSRPPCEAPHFHTNRDVVRTGRRARSQQFFMEPQIRGTNTPASFGAIVQERS